MQRLFGRRTNTLLPTSNQLLKPKIPTNIEDKARLRKAKQTWYYNRGVTELEELNPGDTVRIQPQKSQFKKKDWTRATVEGKVNIRSYQVRTEDGRAYRRNRRHLRRTQETVQKDNPETTYLPTAMPSFPDSSSSVRDVPVQPATSPPVPNLPVQKPPLPKPLQQTAQPSPVITTRSGRVIRAPMRFADK